MAASLTAIFNAQDRISNALAGIDKKGSDVTDMFKKLAVTAGAAFSAKQIIDFGKSATMEFVDFQGSMNEVFTLLPDISKSAMGKMSGDVKGFAKDMGTLPEKVVPALYESLSSGVPQDTVFDFLKTSNKAAIGGVTTLETTVNGLTSVLNAYGTDVIDAASASDIMFQAVKIGKTTFEELSNSLYNVNPTAAALGIKFGDISAALAAMTAQGVPTAVSTTQLRQAMVELSQQGTKVDKIFRQVAGKSFKDFIAGGGNLQQAFQKLEGYAKKTNLGINDLFGSVEAGSAVLSLTGKGTDLFTQAMDAMANAAGATDAAYETLDNGMARKLDKMKAAWSVSKLGIGEAILDSFMPMFEYVSENMDDISGGIRRFFDFVGVGARSAWQVAKPMLEWIEENPDTVASALGGIGAAIVTYKVATGIQSVALAMKTMNATMLISPVGIFTAIAAGLVAVGIAVYNSEKRLAKADLDAHFGKIALSTEDLDAAVQHILKNDSLGKLDKALKAFDALSVVKDSISEAIETVERMNWKVGIGMQLTVDEKTQYKNAIDSFVKNSIKAVEDKQYAISLAVDAYFGNSNTGTEFKTSIDQFYSGYKDKLTVLGQQLQEAVLVGYQNGWSIDSTQAVNNIMKSMTEITDKIAQAQSEAKIQTLQLDFLSGNITPESFEKLQGQLNTELDNLKSKFNDTRINLIAEAKLQLSDGKIDQAAADKMIQDIEAQYQKNVGDLAVKSLNFQTDTISKAYESELQNAFVGDDSSVSRSTRAALTSLYKNMQPTVKDVQDIALQYEVIPKSIEDALFGASVLSSFTTSAGTYNDYIKMLYAPSFSATNEEWQKTLAQSKDRGVSFSKGFLDGIELYRQPLKDTGGNLGQDTLTALKTSLEKGVDATIPVSVTVKMTPNFGDFKQLEGNASGTDNASNVFVAGEHGPELIVGAGGSTVYTNSDTRRILSTTSRPVDFTADQNAAKQPDQSGAVALGARQFTIKIEGAGEIKVNGGVDKSKVVDIMTENIRPVLLKLLKDEAFEEGDLSYEY